MYAYVCTYVQGNYGEAARLYIKANQRKKAIEMYLDLRDWEKAKEIVESMQSSSSSGSGVSESAAVEGESASGAGGETGKRVCVGWGGMCVSACKCVC